MINRLNENIIKRTKQVFLTMFQVEVEAGAPYIVDSEIDTGWDISGVISVAGSLSGLITMRYHRRLAQFLLEHSRLQSMDYEMNHRMLNDMIGEVANTIAGNVLSEIVVDELLISIPVAIQGENHTISWPRNTEITAVPFKIGSETFVVQAGLK
ncbi:MAG: chemotaxis protein CheX [Spirochaetales bacterium]|nr:chemotaxis protein CheX [Spirochaetales bacterium]